MAKSDTEGEAAAEEPGVINIDQLRIGQRAFFYSLTDALKGKLLLELLVNAQSGKQIFADHARYLISGEDAPRKYGALAAVIQEFNPEPRFLDRSELRERRYGLLVAACSDLTLAVHATSGSRWSQNRLEGTATPYGRQVIADFMAMDSEFRKVTMRWLGASDVGIYLRTLEAANLDESLSPSGLNRNIVRGTRVHRKGRLLSTNPQSGRVAESGKRLTPKEFLKWVADQGRLLQAAKASPGAASRGFLSKFAREATTSEMKDLKVDPTGVLLDLGWLQDGLEDGTLTLLRKIDPDADAVAMDQKEVQALLEGLTGAGQLSAGGKDTYKVQLPKWSGGDLQLKRNKLSFGLRGLDLRQVRVRDEDANVEQTLGRKLTEEGSLLVTTSDIRYTFAQGALYRDPGILSYVPSLRHILDDVAELSTCTSEKGGAIKRGQTSYEDHSVFKVIDETIAVRNGDAHLLCDDMDKEWADFIGIAQSGDGPVISLYHGKHGDPTLGASPFQEVIGQALKNVGRIAVVEDDFAKLRNAKWKNGWKTKKGTRRLPRLRRQGTLDQFCEAYVEASRHPTRRARVCLVTSFLSKGDLEGILTIIENSTSDHPPVLQPNETQLVHLLTSFATATLQSGALPVVYCRP